jgi:hypothetical protein
MVSNDSTDYAQRLVQAGLAADVAVAVAQKTQHVGEPPTTADLFSPDLSVGAPKRRATKKPGKADDRLIKTAAEIAIEDVSGDDMAFTHAVFCQVGLPRAKIEGREFLRQSGSAWISVQAGWLDEGRGPVEQPIPYGPLPRLTLAHLSTFAVRNKTREIPIGDSAAQYLELMGMGDDGRRYKALRQQMHALAACRLQLGYKGRTFNGNAIQQFDAWVQNKDPKQRSLWPGKLVLSESFYSELLDGAVPLDNRALQALKGSALALDIYTWLAHRLHRIEGHPKPLPWKSIRDQFAQEYTGANAAKDFKRTFLPALNKVLAVYPQAKVKRVNTGLLLLPSAPPVPYKG